MCDGELLEPVQKRRPRAGCVHASPLRLFNLYGFPFLVMAKLDAFAPIGMRKSHHDESEICHVLFGKDVVMHPAVAVPDMQAEA
jgi:hypothetical protein